MLIQPAAFQQPLRTIPENKGAVLRIAHFTQLVDADAGIGCSFFQRQIAFLPNRDFFHRQNLRIFVCNQQTVTATENFSAVVCWQFSVFIFSYRLQVTWLQIGKSLGTMLLFLQMQGVTKPVTNRVKWPFKTEIPFAGLLRL